MATEFPSAEDLLDQATDLFKQEFSSIPDVAVCAPKVINLIGEHTDNNEGLTMLIAVGMVTVIVGRCNFSENICVISTLDDGNPKVDFHTSDLTPGHPPWGNYIKGAIKHFPDAVVGFDALIVSSLPLRSKFSSNASLLVAVYTFLEALMNSYAANLNDKALACHQAEQEYFDLPCGISNSVASIFGEHRKVLFVDTRPLECRLLAMDNYSITFMMLKLDELNQFSISDLQTRVTQCNDACKVIGKSSLRDVTLQGLLEFQNTLDPVLFNRAKYVISENQRVLEALEALKNKNFHLFGKLMVESHISMRDEYELSCEEVEQLYEVILNFGEKQKGSILGAHLTSDLGCIIVMINKSAVNGFMEYIWTNFKGKAPEFYITPPSYGARVLRTSFRKDLE